MQKTLHAFSIFNLHKLPDKLLNNEYWRLWHKALLPQRGNNLHSIILFWVMESEWYETAQSGFLFSVPGFLFCFAFLIIIVILKWKPEGRWWKKSPESRCVVWETNTSAVFIIQTTESKARYKCSWLMGMLNERLRRTVELCDPLYLSTPAYHGT